VYLEPIDALAERAPKAYLVRRAREFEGPIGSLGPIQRGILRSILRGESAKSIAAELGRSPFTVINHTRRIFEAFEVHSRPELRRACAKLKITPESIP
jgi:DNA-binding NarL/FixJ family response regulator